MKQQLRLTPNQMASMLLIEGCIAAMQTASNQLGGFLKCEKEAKVIVKAAESLIRDYELLRREWGNGIIEASPSEVATLSRVIAP